MWYAKGNIFYLNNIVCLDTETSHNDICGWIYQWAVLDEDALYYGRKPSEIIELLKEFVKQYNLDSTHKMVIYVHNLSYDLTYLFKWLFDYDSSCEVFWMDSHKALTCRLECFEFRCSYILSNMSLDQWGKKLGVKHKKLVGTVDYSKVRYQDTPLTKKDWKYQFYDVLTLKECIEIELHNSHDTLATIPLTSTGYVRRDCRKAVSHDNKYREWFLKTQLNKETYRACRQAFSGGYVHANRFYAGKTVISKIGHNDYKSFYPSYQMLGYYPITSFIQAYNSDIDGKLDSEVLKHYINTKCCLLKITLENTALHKEVTAPYLQKAKLIGDFKGCQLDNGRVLRLKSKCSMWVTELDFKIILDQYDSDIEIMEIYTSERGEFPKQFKEKIIEYFKIKENLNEGYLYMKSKNKLNAIYGMSVTDIIRPVIQVNFETGEFTKTKDNTDESIEERLNKFYKSRNNFFPYQVGVWVTAQCRYELLQMIKKIGYENFLYCDTDSIFFIYNDNAIKIINEYNDNIIKECKQKGYYVSNIDGGESYFKTFEDEKEGIKQFRALHSKCYAFIDKNDNLNVTIAGVSKKGRNNKTIAKELGNIDNLKDGFTFYHCGSTKSKYLVNDCTIESINGHLTEYADSCIITDNVKTLSYDSIKEYEEIEVYEYGD